LATPSAHPVGHSAEVQTLFRIPGLDGLRSVAILIVFIGHAGLPTVVGAGTGVTLFFFLSGYLITTLLRREYAHTGSISLRDFYLRRALRILPPVYIFLSAAFTLAATHLVPAHITGVGVAAALLQFTNFVIIFGHPANLLPGAGLLWSLAIEEHFYLLFPLLYLALLRRMSPKRLGTALVVLCLFALAWRCVLVFRFGADYDRTYYGTDTRADSLLFGCLLAVSTNPVLDRARVRPERSLGFLVVGALLVITGEHLHTLLSGLGASAGVGYRADSTVGPTVQAMGLWLTFTAILSAPLSVVGRLLNWWPLVRLGVLSYSFYLFHGLVLTVIQDHTGLGKYPRAVLGFIVTLVISETVHLLVERPATDLRRRLGHQPPRPRVSAAHPGSVAAHEIVSPTLSPDVGA